MREKRWIALAAIVLAALPAAAQDERPAEPFVIEGEDAPLSYVIENFLTEAAGWYALDDRDPFEDFCHDYGIDPTWPSAAELGTAGPGIHEEYRQRVVAPTKQGGVSMDTDPDEWKPTQLGRAFGDLYAELREDGLPWDLEQFIRLIEKRIRHTIRRYSDRPYDDDRLTADAELFWKGLAASCPEAADLAEERRDP